MSSAALQLAEEKLIEFAKSVEISATKVLEGLHTTPHGGRGIEFHSGVAYTPGEDARYIDWKRYAATDRLTVNRFEREERSSWRVWVDRSASMHYREKVQWTNLWAGSILFLAKAFGDSWRLQEGVSHSIEEAFRELCEERPKEVPLSSLIEEASATTRLIIFSDFFCDLETLKVEVKKLSESYHSVHLIQILSAPERSFDFDEVVEFLDFESSGKLILDATHIRAAYIQSFLNLEKELKALVSDHVSFMLAMCEGESLEKQLIEFFEHL